MIDQIYAKGLKHGALGGKLLGAGGGGFIAFFIDPERKNEFVQALAPLNCVDFKMEFFGSKIIT